MAKSDTVEGCIDLAMQSDSDECAAVFVQIAQVRAYEDRTRMLGEVTGWAAGGTYDQYIKKITDALAVISRHSS